MMNMRSLNWENLGWSLLPWVLHLPSLRPIFRFAPHAELVAAIYLLVAIGVSTFLLMPQRRAWLVKLLDRKWIFWAGLAVITVITMSVYPYADGLKAIGRGSDGDDAMILGAQSLLAFGNPYHYRTYLGGYLSPGPGWVLLVLPLSLTGLYAMVAPLSVLAAGLVARGQGIAWGKINLFIALLFSSVAAWEMTTTGIDHIPIGVSLLALLMGCLHARKRSELVALAILLGMVATSRVVFFYWPALVAFIIIGQVGWRAGWRQGLLVGGIGTLVTLGIHVWGWATSVDMYHPVHVLSKTEMYDTSGGTIFSFVTLAICAVTGTLMLWKWFKWPRYVLAWMGVFVPLLCTGMGELLMSGNVGYTTLASYTLLGVPFLLAALVYDGETA